MEWLLQVLNFTSSFSHLCLVFPNTKDPQRQTSGQGYAHCHLSISQVCRGKMQEEEIKKTREISFCQEEFFEVAH